MIDSRPSGDTNRSSRPISWLLSSGLLLMLATTGSVLAISVLAALSGAAPAKEIGQHDARTDQGIVVDGLRRTTDKPDCEHDAHAGDPCLASLDAKANLFAFQKAVARRGRRLRAVALPGDRERVVAGEVVVLLDDSPDGEAEAHKLARLHGMKLRRWTPSVSMALLAMDGDALPKDDTEAGRHTARLVASIAASPAVRSAEPNVLATTSLTPNDDFFDVQDGLKAIRMEDAWDVTTGDPAVVVAVLDTGVDDTHPDLAGRLVPGFDFVNGTATPVDDNGHGTAVAGLIAANGNNGDGVAGVAFGCSVMPIKVADGEALASYADIVAGIDFARQNGARIVCLAMGARTGSTALETAVQTAAAAGVVIVAAAGNDPIHQEMFPAAYPEVVSVAATSSATQPELSFGTVVSAGVDVAAPGEQLPTTLPGGVYGFVSGTSASTGVVSGIAALALSQSAALSGEQLRQLLRQASDPIPAFATAGLTDLYRFGRIDARDALDRADPGLVDVAIRNVRTYPTKLLAGSPSIVEVDVENRGHGLIQQVIVVARQNGIEVGVLLVRNIAVGERRTLRYGFSVPSAPAAYVMEGEAFALPGETLLTDNSFQINTIADTTVVADVRVSAVTVGEPLLTSASLPVSVTVENLGTRDETNVPVSISAAGSAPPAQVIPTLAVGNRLTLTFQWPLPAQAPSGLVAFEAQVAAVPGETATDDNLAFFETVFEPASARPARGLYQQSNSVDVIWDAPARVSPGRGYVPVQLFVAAKGGSILGSDRLEHARARVTLKDRPEDSAPGTVIYDDEIGVDISGQGHRHPGGLEIVNEIGVVRRLGSGAPDPNLFGDAALTSNGRHDILRIPRAALGIADPPASDTTVFLDSQLDWRTRRRLLWVFNVTRNGSARRVLRVTFGSQDLPRLSGEGHYYDTHYHTIAEWFFDNPINILAPRKAYGGPLQMVMESAWAMGLIDDPNQVAGRIITTDHSCFYNDTIPDPDGPGMRPPSGHSAPSSSPGPGGSVLSEHARYREIFGISAGEEVAFKQDIPLPRINGFVNALLNMLPGLPLGAHMLVYRAEHFEGPWHGGGFLKGSGSPRNDVELRDVLQTMAQSPQNGNAFSYAAHPFSGQGWNDSNIDMVLGLSPQNRTRTFARSGAEDFVFKGWEFWNGRDTRALPKGSIDFENLNPFQDPAFSSGSNTWDKSVEYGFVRYHQHLDSLLDFSFTSDPDTHFIRKLYVAAGSDAHGDFNFSTGRLATPVSLSSTFSVSDGHFGAPRTYVLPEGKPGSSFEERAMKALDEGNSLVTDGPLVRFRLDANGHFDSDRLVWHEGTQDFENADGQIGGEGAFDGGRTALVPRGSADVLLGYQHVNNTEFGGPIAAIKIYRTSPGDPNPTENRSGHERLRGRGSLTPGAPGVEHVEAIDPSEEGTFDGISAIHLGGFTGGDPDAAPLSAEEHRCYTNPVFVVPFDVDVTAGSPDPTTATLAPGSVSVTFTFDISMEDAAYAVEAKALDGSGESSDGSVAGHAFDGSWQTANGIASSQFVATNRDPISVSGAGFPNATTTTFVVYFRDAPRDVHGNPLNSIATTFASTRLTATGGGGSGTTTPGSTSGSTSGAGAPSKGRASGRFSCLIGQASDHGEPWSVLPLTLLLLAMGLARRQQR